MPTNQSEEQTRKAHKQGKKRNKQQSAETEMSSAAHTRKQHKQHQKEEKKKQTKPRRRLFPIWLRIIVVLLLAIAALMAGLMIGYGLLGDGNPLDVLRIETWQHIIDFVMQE
ncbi:DNA-directed RNA polymerase subunit beta [Virgibacillus sp. NKC19-3]|uniref:DNA-directed RNA polymerase subunit beta n=1 Tax=Virgibacillus saliphilus TaxID=2831674 RepID=UPI001C9AB264|nr:DNA-directed RNA polymerase subunit beta [Virgibacillus sp. NKC19-3]MBY7144701.1 DNA-directed RNA polymerase subunit beta [Virgibacillus sp. NKC19-3]